MTENEIQDKKLQRFSSLLLILAVTFLVFAAGYRLGEYKTKQQAKTANSTTSVTSLKPSQEPENMALFWSVWALIEQKYADQSKVKPKQMIYGAIKGLVASLEDPYSYFMTPEENQQSKDDLGGKYEGIGAELGMKNNQIMVVTPLENSPAKAAGVRSGDIILAVDDQPTQNWTLTQTVDKIRGEKDTIVKLTLFRNNQDFEIKIKRDQIKIESVKLSYKSRANCSKNCSKAAMIKVSNFGDNTVREWDRAVAEVKAKWQNKAINGLIIDVRSNPGGYLDAAVYLASEFLPINSLVIKQEYADRPAKEYKVARTGQLLDIPVVILINEGSASASEIFAGALRDYDRAELVGRKSFGKGSVQEALDLTNNTGLHLTIAKWILPKGDWINSKGIEPDFDIEIKLEDGNTLEDKTDTQLQKAINILIP
ncbi:hypothetical protein A2313_00340 [Candidatus Roizmanbacteria bacterium RIFOXYB2_FULL_41_10]|uniref:PDZ domain-containing protein n=1 Tax=Candidatus Roizmanbacteria bacterium RIFOXYA1_FULL_41_12 TaxID=1802082 RepID=A0A1F7KAL5_9BACT|nr:MAG: hypothetical protein A2262_01335 [Candidatus Roizmanbacteria bacterium RIFOXYA2_FULL_41_8]OGK64905.1 MAG: hypothetical protein A2209_04380 [Candidatus Roizmanbacteria bacterium RIFOXYA1_FULL_41_12]OGK66834.1 MAG: hypothetical protein A2377_02945 [Candidatus Roizmanbacteria bacterium RIFOXYB1_FULL_41_27]OGK70792.1 MAG: hypothetical protein A2403_01760 [Candidatus Roizmanbacteria bacterium RIFOXYC1_FULL_41_16]OGK71416.1 MAG: hypothetical protein A2313_00340 [Candidatus Roizmanbacteria bac